MSPLVTVVIPSLNQGRFLDRAVNSVFEQNIPLEVFLLDAGSTDNSIEVIRKWESRFTGWRSHRDLGQASAINEGISMGSAPYVCWLNSDDWFLPGALQVLVSALESNPSVPAAYGRVNNYFQKTSLETPVWVEPFSQRRLAMRCIVSQPGSLIRRKAWESLNGLDESLSMAMDYDLWWRLFKNNGPLKFVDQIVAINRVHPGTKTRNFRKLHYKEAMKIVKRHNGELPLKWFLFQPYAIWFKALERHITCD
jgi:glycosyltransferase involved in cell wall biosynthesis